MAVRCVRLRSRVSRMWQLSRRVVPLPMSAPLPTWVRLGEPGGRSQLWWPGCSQNGVHTPPASGTGPVRPPSLRPGAAAGPTFKSQFRTRLRDGGVHVRATDVDAMVEKLVASGRLARQSERAPIRLVQAG